MHGDFGFFWSGSDSTWSSRECGKAELFSGFCHNGLLAQKKNFGFKVLLPNKYHGQSL